MYLFKSKKTVIIRKWLFKKFYIAESVKRILARTIFPGLIFKACVYYFHKMFIFSLNDSPSKTMKNELFSFSRYSIFCISVLPSFSACHPLLRGWSEINLKVHDDINCLNNSWRTHFLWYLEKEKSYDIETLYIDGVSDKEQFYRKIMQKIGSKS